MAHVRIEAVSPEITPPPPILPTKVPTHLKHHQTAKAAKTTWFMETKRADITGKEVSDEKLNLLYNEEVVSSARRQATGMPQTVPLGKDYARPCSPS